MSFNKYLSIKSILKFSSLNYLQAALSFCTALLLARQLGPELYGYYTYGIIFNTSFFVLVQYGMDKTLVRDLVQRNQPEHILVASTLIKTLLTVLGLFLIIIWGLIFKGDSSEKIWIGLLFAASGSLFGLSPRAWYDYQGKIQMHAVLLFFERLLFFIGVCFLLFIAKNTSIVYKVGIVLLSVRYLLFLVEWAFVIKTMKNIRLRKLKYFIKPILRVNSWVWFAAINNLLMTNANQFILENQLGTKALGYYGFALQLVMLVQLMQSQLARLASPSIAKTVQFSTKKQIFRKYWKDLRLCLGITICLLIPVYFLAPKLIEFLGGKDYLNALPILRVFCAWSLVYGIALINNQYLLSFRLQRTYFWVTAFFGVSSIGLVWLLINQFGARGAALSLLITHAGSVLVQFILVFKKIKSHVQISQSTQDPIIQKETKIGTA